MLMVAECVRSVYNVDEHVARADLNVMRDVFRALCSTSGSWGSGLMNSWTVRGAEASELSVLLSGRHTTAVNKSSASRAQRDEQAAGACRRSRRRDGLTRAVEQNRRRCATRRCFSPCCSTARSSALRCG